MQKGRVIDDFSNMKDDDLVGKVKLVYTSMKSNKDFAKPTPGMDKFGAGLTAFENAVLASKNGGAVEMAERDTQRKAILVQMKTLMAFVNYTADGNRTMLESSGFTVNALTRSSGKKLGQISVPVAKPGNNSGEEKLQIKKVENAIAHLFQITTMPVTDSSIWIPVPGKSRCTAKNLVRGTEYAARVFVTGRGEHFGYSDIITFIAI